MHVAGAESLVRHRHNLAILDVLAIALDEAGLALDEAERLAELHVFLIYVFAIVFLVGPSHQAAFFVPVGGPSRREIL